MGHISSKTLTQRLRVLEELGFVQRRAFLEIPPRVEYHLTEKGQELGDVIAAIEQFAQKNLSTPLVPSLMTSPHRAFPLVFNSAAVSLSSKWPVYDPETSPFRRD